MNSCMLFACYKETFRSPVDEEDNTEDKICDQCSDEKALQYIYVFLIVYFQFHR